MLQMLPASLEDQLIATQRQIDALLLEQSRLAARFAESQAWVGEEEGRMQRTVAALEQGELGFAHLLVMATTAKFTGKAFDEERLLPLALKGSPGKFHYQCLHYRHAVDAWAYNQDQERLAEARNLSLSTAEDGCLLISGLLDPPAEPRCATPSSRWPSPPALTTAGLGSSAWPMP